MRRDPPPVPSLSGCSRRASCVDAPRITGELIRDFIRGSIDPALAITTTLSSLSLLTQGLADIAWPNQMSCPVGISVLLVAVSGGGKGIVFSSLLDPIRQRIAEHASDSAQYGKTPMFFVEDTTREAVILHLLEWPVAGLITDEAGQVKRLMKGGGPTFAKLIDGTPMHHARVSTGRAELKGHRFMFLAMLQPDQFDECKSAFGVGNGGVGLVNRFLVGAASSSPNLAAMTTLGLSGEAKARYGARVNTLVKQVSELVLTRGIRPVLRMSSAAERRFVEIATEIMSLQHDFNFSHIREYVSRHCERTLRTAGSLHVTDHGAEGEIEIETIEAAHQLDLWSIDAYAGLASVEVKPTRAEIDSKRLDAELTMVAHRYGPHLAMAPLRRMVANIGMTRTQFDRALPLLAEAGKITLYVRGREDMILVNLPHAPWLDFGKRT